MMISKTNTAESIGKTLGYCMNDPDRYEILEAHGLSGDKKQMIRLMELQHGLNPRIKKPMLHIMLSHHPKDTQKIRGREIEIVDTWLAEMKKQKGFDLKSTQYVIIKHHDRDHIHYHICASMVTNSGQRLNIDYLGLKGKDISKQITKRYNLTPAVRQEFQREVIEHGYQIQQGIKYAMYNLARANAPKKSSEEKDLIIRIKRNKNNGLSIS